MKPSPLRRWSKAAFRWSWLVSLPATVLWGLWLVRVSERYFTYDVRWGAREARQVLQRIGDSEARYLARSAALALRPAETPRATDLPRVQLFVAESELARLEERMPHSGRNYVDASLVHADGSLESVEIKYRGDFHWHWAFVKKSLRVKTSKRRLYQGMRAFNVIVPKFYAQLNNHLSYRLAERLELVAPHSEMVELWVNSSNRGLHLQVEQLEEMVLRRHRRMPGDLFVGELIGRDQIEGLDTSVFHHPETWQKVAVNNHFPEESRESIEELCRLVTGPLDEQALDELGRLVDLQAFGRFSALRALLQTNHFDRVHNWRLYYDPWRNVFEPVVWDPTGWPSFLMDELDRGAATRPDVIGSLLDEMLMSDYRFLLARQRAFEEFYGRDGDGQLLAELDGLIERLGPVLDRDPALIVAWKWHQPGEIRRAMVELRRQVRGILEDLEALYLEPPRVAWAFDEAAPGRLRISIDGRRPVDGWRLELDRAPSGPVVASLSWQQNGERRRADVSGAVTIAGRAVELDVPLLSSQVLGAREDVNEHWRRGIRVSPGVYDLELELGEARPRELIARVGERSLRAVRTAEIETSELGNVFHAVTPVPVRELQVWSGERTVSGVTTIRDDVRLEPGCRLRMEPGASLIFEGRLTASGTADEPIVVTVARPRQEPWGVLALRGPGADGSRLESCRFEGGSGLKDDLYEYSAMFSIHDVPTVTVANTVFRDSRVVDDMVHTVYSHVEFRGCTFARSAFDALDMDVSTGLVENCSFVGSGNDALDLMTSEVVVRDSVLRGSGDKGLSVGEATRLFASGVRILECAIGVQVKDSSEAVLYNVELTRNGTAVDAYHKNWRYDGGGTVRIYKAILQDNQVDLTADGESSVRIYDSFLDHEPPRDPRVVVHPTVDSRFRNRPKVRQAWTWPEDRVPPSDLLRRAWASVQPAVRGVPGE